MLIVEGKIVFVSMTIVLTSIYFNNIINLKLSQEHFICFVEFEEN